MYDIGNYEIRQLVPVAAGLFESGKTEEGDLYRLPLVGLALVRNSKEEKIIPLSLDCFGSVHSAQGKRIVGWEAFPEPEADTDEASG